MGMGTLGMGMGTLGMRMGMRHWEWGYWELEWDTGNGDTAGDINLPGKGNQDGEWDWDAGMGMETLDRNGNPRNMG